MGDPGVLKPVWDDSWAVRNLAEVNPGCEEPGWEKSEMVRWQKRALIEVNTGGKITNEIYSK